MSGMAEKEAVSGAAGGAEARLAAGLAEAFGPRLKAAWLSGSFVYRGAQPGESDIDVVVVLDEATSIPADPETQAAIRRFVDVYLEAHSAAGLEPDLDFPGEYVVPRSLADVFAWRGFAREGAPAQAFPASPSKDYWPGRPERWFNAWLSMTALSRFLAGDRAWHEAMKREAWTHILRFLLLRAEGAKLTEDDLWQRLDQFGVKPRYEALRTMEAESVAGALAALEAEGAARMEGGRIVPGPGPLEAWERRLAAAIAAGAGDEGPLLLPPDLHAALGAYAARRWEEIAPADASTPAR